MNVIGSNMIAVNASSNHFAEKWKGVIACKERFLRNNEDPRNSPYINREVAESWIRSQANGVDPYGTNIGESVSPAELEKIIWENKLMVETALPIMKTFQHLLKLSGYMLTIHNNNGTILHIEGDEELMSSFHEINAKVGSVWNEETVGTTAHSLSMRHRCPIQLIGPENYCILLQDNITSSAPIMDEDGALVGTLVLVQKLGENPWDTNFQNLQSHTLGWITTMAVAIETQMSLKQRNNVLEITNNTLTTTLEFIDEGIITIDQEGAIKHANEESVRILHTKPDEISKRNISELLGEQAVVQKALQNGEAVNYLEMRIPNNNQEQPFFLSIKPVPGSDKDSIGAAVIRLAHARKINDLVINRVGATAKYRFEDIVGNSDTLNEAKELGRKFAHAQENILLIGESGTGKELFAQAIHNESRPNGPFVAVNCAAMPRNLIESELFGYESGAFTGARRNGKPGKIELANGGTLFLDEIGDMPFEIQAVLLRVIEDKKVMRLGGNHYIDVDFKVIAATNQSLLDMVRDKQFREDLYYRLSVLKIEIPPLRFRGNDISLLSQYFIEDYCQRTGKGIPQMSYAVKKKIAEYDWPGNVRQLENAMIYAVNVAHGGHIELEHLPAEVTNISQINSKDEQNADEDSRRLLANVGTLMSIQEAEKLAIKNAIMRCGDIPLAAEILGLGKSTLYRKVKDYDLKDLLK